MGRRITNNDANTCNAAKIWLVAIYIRLSREDGNIESLSIANQKAMLQEYLEKFFVGEYVFVDYYIDDGYTGTDDNRDGFQHMIQDIEAGAVNCVIVKDNSRLFRNYSQAGHYTEDHFVRHGVRYISLGQSIDSFLNPNSMYNIAVPIQNVMNEDFCRQTSEKIRAVFDYKRRNGQYIGAFAPYGYLKDPEDKNQLLIDEDAAQTVKEIFQWFLEGTSKRGIAIRLNQLGVPNPSTYKRQKGIKYKNPAITKGSTATGWNPRTIDKILHDQTYIGNLVQGKETLKSYKVHERVRISPEQWCIVEDAHDRIIERETFDLAQDLLQKDTRSTHPDGEQHLLAGFLRCADCGNSMRRHSSKAGAYISYICRTYSDQGRIECDRHGISEKALIDNILTAIQLQVSLVISMPDLIARINERPMIQNKSARLDALLNERLADHKRVQNLCDCLYEDLKSSILTNSEYRRLKQKYMEQLEMINSAIEKIKQEQSITSEGVTTEHPFFACFMKHQNVHELSREMLVELVEAVYIHEKQPGDKYPRTEIIFKYADQFELVREYIETNGRDIKLL